MATGKERTMELVREAQSGDEQAWTALYNQSWPKVLAVCRKFSAHDYEDIAQTVMVRMFEKIHTYKGTAQFSTWLHRVAVNVCLMHLRSKWSREVGQASVSLDEHMGNVPDRRDWEKAAIARLDLDKVIPTLPPGYKRILVVRDWFGYDTMETAALVKKSESLVKSQLRRGRIRAREGMIKAKAAGAE